MNQAEEIKKLNDRLNKAAKEVLRISGELVNLKAEYKLMKFKVDKFIEFTEDQERTNRKLLSEMNDIARTQEQINKRLNKLESSKD